MEVKLLFKQTDEPLGLNFIEAHDENGQSIDITKHGGVWAADSDGYEELTINITKDPKVYKIGDRTMNQVFNNGRIPNLHDLQIVFDAMERALTPPPVPITAPESKVIKMLVDMVREVYHTLDDTEDDGGTLTFDRKHFDKLSDMLDKFDELPADHPNFHLGPAAKAELSLHRLVALPELGDGKPMEGAPKKRPILALCNHQADPGMITLPDGRRTMSLYAAHGDMFSRADNGFHILEWGGSFDDGEDGHLPDWWFVTDTDFEVAANPIMYWELPKVEGYDEHGNIEGGLRSGAPDGDSGGDGT